jgi:hypothetical protein
VVVEQDWTSRSPFKSMLESREYLRKIGYWAIYSIQSNKL